jgi:hypothetical protein
MKKTISEEQRKNDIIRKHDFIWRFLDNDLNFTKDALTELDAVKSIYNIRCNEDKNYRLVIKHLEETIEKYKKLTLDQEEQIVELELK